MKKQTSTQAIWLRSLLLLPLVALLLYGFSTREVIQKEVLTEQTQLQEKATKAEVEEYNTLAKKYNNMPKDNIRINTEEVKRFSFLYRKMTLEQRKKAEPFPVVDRFPGPPPTPDAPKVEQVPPVPPVPPVPTAPSVPDDLKLAKEVQEKGGEFYLNDKKIGFNAFKNKLAQIKTNNQGYNITLEKGDNGKDRLRVSIQK